MNNKVFVSCAVTGSGDAAKRHPNLPKTPEQIAKVVQAAAINPITVTGSTDQLVYHKLILGF